MMVLCSMEFHQKNMWSPPDLIYMMSFATLQFVNDTVMQMQQLNSIYEVCKVKFFIY